MLSRALKFVLFRFLPRRLMPLFAAVEIFRLVRGLRRRGPAPVPPRRIVTVDPQGMPEDRRTTKRP
ncbi:MAG: hypothetical protein H0U37_06240 [Chloroflexi bacterium]|nr:hypothetical protein [Chloroflexota bacterium]